MGTSATPQKIRQFYLERIRDISGVSGEGIVAEGVQFPDGRCVMMWTGNVRSIAIYDNIQEIIAVHGHDGATKVVWFEED